MSDVTECGRANAAESTPASQVETVEIAGRIKWFDMSKGYGFVIPDDGSADVLLHVTVLRASGFPTALEGSRVVCDVKQCQKGRQVARVVAMDESTAVHPLSMSSRTHAQVESVGGFEIAIVKWFNRVKGFGFLTRGEGTEDIFFHMETVRHCGITDLEPNDSVLVRYGDGPKGLMAVEVRPLTTPATQRHAAE